MVVFGQRLDLIIFEVFSSLLVLWCHENKAVCWFGAAKTHLCNPDWGLTWVPMWLLCPLPSLQTHDRHPQDHGAEPFWSLGHHTRDLGLFFANRKRTRPHQSVGHDLCRLWARAGEWSWVLVLTLQHLKLSPFSPGILSPVSGEAGKSLWSCLQDWGEIATWGPNCKDDARSWIYME